MMSVYHMCLSHHTVRACVCVCHSRHTVCECMRAWVRVRVCVSVVHLEGRIHELEKRIKQEQRAELDTHDKWKKVLEKTSELQKLSQALEEVSRKRKKELE